MTLMHRIQAAVTSEANAVSRLRRLHIALVGSELPEEEPGPVEAEPSIESLTRSILDGLQMTGARYIDSITEYVAGADSPAREAQGATINRVEGPAFFGPHGR